MKKVSAPDKTRFSSRIDNYFLTWTEKRLANDTHTPLRNAVRELCTQFPDSYWRDLDTRREYPDAFVKALTEAGYLAALIPEEYGGSGLTLSDASVILEEINRNGGNAAACHAQMYIMGTLLRHGSAEQKRAYLPRIAAGELRLQAFGVSERHRAATRRSCRRKRCESAITTW